MALTLENVPKWQAAVLGLLLAVAAVAGMEYGLVKGIKVQIAEADTQISALEEKIQQGRAAERKLPQFREEVKRLELELEKLRRILPSTRNTEEIIKKVKSLVDQGDFTLHRTSFPAVNLGSSDPYVEWPISISLDGRYHDLAILFNRLGNFSRIMNVENIVLRALPNQESRTITAQFIAKTFVYIEPKAPEGAKPGGG
ncbi:MAG TPA: type 4a pilus biogenesis protein PilO [Thermoanaerobaculia bacterium]|nr:type 4a pilus biogenesis protein PilO [Thermoanaerobaculia bacterium]